MPAREKPVPMRMQERNDPWQVSVVVDDVRQVRHGLMPFIRRRRQRLRQCQLPRIRVDGVDGILPVPEVLLHPARVVFQGLGHDDDFVVGDPRGGKLGERIGFGAEGVDDEGGDVVLVPDVVDGVGGFEGGVEEGSEEDEEEGKEEEAG